MEAHHHHHQKQAREKKSLDTKHGTTKTTTYSDQGMKENQLLSSSSASPANSSKQQVPISSPASPPSASSSPSHEFSFTISLSTNTNNNNNHNNNNNNKAKTPPMTNSFAVDLSPADEIFFHGHLLPLHLLSHLPVSPRSSTNSLDSFTLPIKELSSSSSSSMEDIQKQSKNGSTGAGTANGNNDTITGEGKNGETNGRNKPTKSFSLFGLAKWRKGYEFRERDYDDGGEDDDKDDYNKEKRPKRSKVRFELSQVLKRYMRMVRPLLFFQGRRETIQLRRQPHSFSGVLNSTNSRSSSNKRELRGRRGEYSAPASMRTSPSNSGLLVATAAAATTTSDSTMEELQAAIQAAIAHCKNSINATEDKVLKF